MDQPTFTSSVHYRDPKAALAWLERAFGFEVTMAIDGPPEAPEMCHYEMSCAGRGPHHDRRRVGRLGAQPGERGRRQHPDRSTCSCRAASTSTASGRAPRAPRSWPSPRTSSTATAPTAPSTSRATAGSFAMHGPRRLARRGRGGDRPADHGHAAGRERAAPTRSTTTLAALADPVRRRRRRAARRAPAPRRRARRASSAPRPRR